jgi:hypothetical protein
MPEKTACLGLLRRRHCLIPTLRGWAVLITCGGLLAGFVLHGLYPFLAVNDPQPGGALVVDGGEDDAGLHDAIAEFRRRHYDKLYVMGGPILTGALVSDYPDYAVQGAARLLEFGLGANDVQPVPATRARWDPTYHQAVTLEDWMRQHQVRETAVNVLAEGPGARRVRLMFERAFGKGVRVGVVALPPRTYDPDRWWKSSQGVRVATGEILGYGYARFFFCGSKE